jgi:hypothetical protein
MTTEPKTKQLSLTAAEGKGRLGEFSAGPVKIRFKLKNGGYYSYYSSNSAYIKFDLENGIIKAQVSNPSRFSFTYYTKKQLDEFLAWAGENSSWHSLKVKRVLNAPKTVAINEDFTVPDPNVDDFRYIIEGALHVPITDKQRKEIQSILDARKEVKAKKRAADRKRREAYRKSEKLRKLRDEALVESDLSYALAILKKNGLKIVTVDEAKPKKKK